MVPKRGSAFRIVHRIHCKADAIPDYATERAFLLGQSANGGRVPLTLWQLVAVGPASLLGKST
jgi:hypothetical protein